MLGATGGGRMSEETMTTYKLTVLSVSEPIPRGTGSQLNSWIPWHGSQKGDPITLHDPQLSEIEIADNNQKFNHIFDEVWAGRPFRQIVVETVHVGHEGGIEVPAGTPLTSFFGSVIADEDGNEYLAMYLRADETGNRGEELGDGTALVIMPYLDERGGPFSHDVPFDPAKAYHFDRFITTTSKLEVPYPPQSAPCFTTGTLIDTALGPRPIEELRPGDLIRSRDRGWQPLRWIGAARLDPARLDLQPALRPIRIRAGTLGPGLPERDLTVSPQHRVLIRSVIAARMFGQAENLVAAKHLTALPGIDILTPPEGVTYWHMLFDRHEVVRSNGAWSESLFTGPQAMKSLGAAARREILSLFPELSQPGRTSRGARPFLTGRQGRKLAERHSRNRRMLMLEDV